MISRCVRCGQRIFEYRGKWHHDNPWGIDHAAELHELIPGEGLADREILDKLAEWLEVERLDLKRIELDQGLSDEGRGCMEMVLETQRVLRELRGIKKVVTDEH